MNDTYNHQEGYNGCGQYNNRKGGRRCSICFTCFNNDHLNPLSPYKDQINLQFYTKCAVGDHSLGGCPIMLENIINKRNVNHYLEFIRMTFLIL